MLVAAIIIAILLLLAIILVLGRALDYIKQHPELITNGTPLAYQRCQVTLTRVVARFKEIEGALAPGDTITWNAPDGYHYTLDRRGIERQRATAPNGAYFLAWENVGGVGVRMQPGFSLVDHNGDGWADSQYTTGYSFHLLIVPISGHTMNILIPTNDRDDAVDFAAYTLALADQQKKRINVFGFNRAPAPHRQRVSKI